MSAVLAMLKRNHVLIEVGASCILSVVAIVISCSSLEVAKRQADIQRVQISPTLTVTAEQEFDAARGQYANLVVRVVNSGYPLSEFQSDMFALYEVTRQMGVRKSVAYVPVGFLCCEFRSQDTKGILTTYRQPDNNTQSMRIDREWHQGMAKRDTVSFALRLVLLSTLSYKDAEGNRREQNFLVRPVTGGWAIAQSEAATWRGRHHAALRLGVDINQQSFAGIVASFDEACDLAEECRRATARM